MSKHKGFRRLIALMSCCALVAAAAVTSLPASAATGDVVLVVEDFNDAGDKAWNDNKEDPNNLTYTVVDSNTARDGAGLDGIDGKAIQIASGGGITFQNHFSERMDLSKYGDMTYALKVRIYFDNFNWPNDNQDNDWGVEITSNGGADMKAYRWGKNFMIQPGWNELLLPISPMYINSGGTGPAADLSKINYIRIYSTYNPTTYAILDEVAIVKYDTDPGPQKSGDTTTLCTFDAATYITAGSIDTTNKKQGVSAGTAGSWTSDAYPAVTWKYNVLGKPNAPGANTGLTMTNGAVKVWLYVKDLNSLAKNEDGKYEYQLELTSSKEADKNELCWSPDQFELKQGWNEYTLRFSDAMEVGEACDLSNINYARFYVKGQTATLIAMDDLRTVKVEDIGGPDPGTSSEGVSSEETSSVETSSEDASSEAASSEETSSEADPGQETSSEDTTPVDTSSAAEEDTASEAESSEAAGTVGEEDKTDGGSGWLIALFVALGVLIVAGAAVAVYFLVIRKAPAAESAEEEAPEEDAEENDQEEE